MVSLLSEQSAKAQIRLISGNQQLIEEAVQDGIFIVRQQYQLMDTTAETPEYWGLNGALHFGASYSLGVKTTKGYYLDRKAVYPWLYDDNFDEYRDSDKFAPVISQTGVRHLDSLAYRAIAFNDKSTTAVADSQFYYVDDSATFGRGFIEDNTAGEKKGWLVWAVSEKTMQTVPDTVNVSMLIYRTELNFVNEQTEYEIKKPSTNKTILGGIYVLPETTDIGVITVKLCGTLLLKDDKWEVVKIRKNDPAAVVPVTGGRLTPVDSPIRNDNSDAEVVAACLWDASDQYPIREEYIREYLDHLNERTKKE
jgi:hypothetical protein